MRLIASLNHRENGRHSSPHCPSQPWEKEGFVPTRVPLNHGKKGRLYHPGASQPWENGRTIPLRGYPSLYVSLSPVSLLASS